MHWNIKEIDAPELARWYDSKAEGFRIIDVREMNEIRGGTLPGADPMPMATVPVRLNELQKDQELVVVCRSGARSAQVCMYLQQQGFDRVYNLRGGMIAWASSGQQVALPRAV
ncbi:rhodanese-like domain-containing protein [Thiohalophilus sp.]|uniref:rhodanese-like domain-containing protein n=1 Tax=Thiohalophilus sp. TaxID=3028392 RepID=UPI002ACD734B|nr:rhodanese-like domain-containing protein [Thiohalophilus sp.]MDZ7804733.1 rhodanese-like domain-containing protein [Thiohalophilus sp.]